MNIFVKVIIFLTALILLGSAFFYATDFWRKKNVESPKVCFKNNCFAVEVAKTPTALEKGLMNRQKLDRNAGMLFVFDYQDIFPFWMKNTFIPLDMIWINKDNKIVFIKENAQPCPSARGDCPVIAPAEKAKYVLEINAGVVKEIDLKTGLTVVFYGIME